jgi:uncharacterized protein YdeI (YjbR/CyaY-like superfamily)
MELDSPEAFRAWLDEHHTQPEGIRLKIAKKGTGIASITYAEALDEALCHGWIDGQKEAFDETWFVQRFTPRRARSRWSKVNRERIERLTAEGRMQPAGLAQVEAAKADGRWDAAYDGSRTATVPDDLQAALDAEPAAKAFFETLTSANRYAILYRVQDAKRPETRAKRIAQYVEMCREGRTLH